MISFRPHHFLCALCFQGKGYSSPFVLNFIRIMADLNDQPDLTIKVEPALDSICAPCPHRLGTNCREESKISELDHQHAAVLQLKPGDILSWKEAQDRIKQQMTLVDFHRICASCEWKKFGMCETTLTKFLSVSDNVTTS